MEEQRELSDSDNAMENGGPAITKMFTLTAEAKIPAVVSYIKELLEEDAEEDKKFLLRIFQEFFDVRNYRRHFRHRRRCTLRSPPDKPSARECPRACAPYAYMKPPCLIIFSIIL